MFQVHRGLWHMTSLVEMILKGTTYMPTAGDTFVTTFEIGHKSHSSGLVAIAHMNFNDAILKRGFAMVFCLSALQNFRLKLMGGDLYGTSWSVCICPGLNFTFYC